MSDFKRAPHRGRRTLLLGLLLAALVALLVQRPALGHSAGSWLAARMIDTLPIAPRELYVWRLRAAGLGDTALAQRWRAVPERAETRALADTLDASGAFEAGTFDARVYIRRLTRGERLLLRLWATGDGQVFAALERRTDAGWTPVAALNANGRVQQRIIAASSEYRLLLQPEIGTAPGFKLAAAVGGSLAFPVAGADAHDIGSGFGGPREGRERAHHAAASAFRHLSAGGPVDPAPFLEPAPEFPEIRFAG